MKYSVKITLIILMISIVLTSCEKRKTIKIIEGTWRVKSMTLDDQNVMNKTLDTLTNELCDSLMMLELGNYDIMITFNRDGTYEKNTDFYIAYVDTALFRQNCEIKPVLRVENEKEQGKWELFNKSTIQMLSGKNSEGNKIKNITENVMEWETDVVVSQGVVQFNGIKKTKLVKE
jgi:hypothetical protein